MRELSEGMEPSKANQPNKALPDLSEPSEALLEWAKENIDEDPDKKDMVLSEFKDMIFEKGECTPTRTDDAFLLRFLRARMFILNKAYRLYVNHHLFMEETPELFCNVNPDTLMGIKNTEIFDCPIHRDQHGRRMFVIKIGQWIPSEFTPEQLLQFVIFLIQIGILEQLTQIKGVVLIFDLSGLSLEMVWYMTPTIAKHLINITITSMPIRIEALHFIYTSWMFETAFSMIKGLIPNNLRNRIHFHNDLDTLHEHLDPKILPKLLGGAQEDYPVAKWCEDIILSRNEKIKTELEHLGYQVQKFLDAAENRSV